MTTLIRHPLFQIALLFCCLQQGVQAADNERYLMQDSEGFTTSLPNVSDITVTQHLLALQQDLETQLSQLKQEVQRKSFKTFDTLVTIFMPGGLLYAKIRHDDYKQSKTQMHRVDESLSQISGELVTFQADNGELMIATAE